MERRSEPEFQTRQFVQRVTFEPRVMTAVHWHGFDVAPSFGVHEIAYDSSITNRAAGNNVSISPATSPWSIHAASLGHLRRAEWLGQGKGAKVKHVIEPRVTYRYVTGIDDFNNVVRFDDTESSRIRMRLSFR